MAKTKVQKTAWLDEIGELFNGSATLFVNFTNLKASEVDTLRKLLRQEGAKLKVVKNTLLRKLLAERQLELPAAVLDQPIAAATGDEVALSKVVAMFKKDYPQLVFHGIIIGQAFQGAEAVLQLSKLPSREQLLGMVVGTIVGPTRGLVTVLAANLQGLVFVLDQKARQLSSN